MFLTKTTSLIFDSLRLAAALTVAYYHCFLLWFPTVNHFQKIFSELAHFSVIIFFVLSGYLIGYTTTNNNRGLKKYLVARFSRLYSVLIPVLVIMFGIEQLMILIDYDSISSITRGLSLPRYFISGLYLNEIWFFSAAPALNAPLWSLSFEFWFYIVFGLWFFRQKSNWKLTVLLILAILIAGPKILSMFPIWLCGILAFKLPKPNFMNSRILFGLAAVIVTFFILFKMPAFPFEIGNKPLFFAAQFIKDWFLGLMVGFVFWLFPLTDKIQKSCQSIDKFRKVADLTYTIYLIHLPLLYLLKVSLNYKQGSLVQYFVVSTIMLLLASAIGFLLESKRQFWTNLFERIFAKQKVKVNYCE